MLPSHNSDLSQHEAQIVTWWRRMSVVILVTLVAATMVLAAWSPWLAVLVPAGVLAVVGLGMLARHGELMLFVTLGLFPLLFSYTEGIQLDELLLTAFYLTYILSWIALRILKNDSPIIYDTIDSVVALFLIYVTASIVLLPVFGGDPLSAAAQWRSAMVLGLYFPIKHHVAQDKRTIPVLLCLFAVFVLFVFIRNVYWYYSALHDSTALWQIVIGRSRMNERLLLIGLLAALALWLYGPTGWRWRLPQAVVVLCGTAGLLLGRSRIMIFALAIGIFLLLLLSDRSRRIKLITVVGAGAFVVVGAAMIVLGDLFWLIAGGFTDRLGTVSTAATQDLSLINRFYEWRATWDEIVKSPIVGHGLGVPYHFYSLLYHVTEVKYYTHNTYLALWYRHGIIGLVLFMTLGIATFVTGIRQLRPMQPGIACGVLLGCLAALPALAIAATMESTLLLVDGVFAYMYPLALMAGLRQSQWLLPSRP